MKFKRILGVAAALLLAVSAIVAGSMYACTNQTQARPGETTQPAP